LVLVHLGVGIAPREVGADAQVGNVARPLDATQLGEVGEVLGDAAVHAQNTRADLGAEGHAVEGIIVRLEERLAESQFALLVEAVGHVDGSGLVVAPEQVHRVGVHDLEAEEERDHFQSEGPAVDVVPKEEVPIFIGGCSVNVEHGSHVLKLSVLIAHHFDRRTQLQHRFLHHEDLPDSVCQLDQLLLLEQRLALERHPHFHQAVDEVLDVCADLCFPLCPFHRRLHGGLLGCDLLGRFLRRGSLSLGHCDHRMREKS
ncbi:hypothetical protein PFISCL1PPCAC_21686, partial [Pristionchus fissidentatus]